MKARSEASVPQILSYWLSSGLLGAGLSSSTCWMCGRGGVERSHLVAHSLGGSGEPHNLILACRSCNLAMPGTLDYQVALLWVTTSRRAEREPETLRRYAHLREFVIEGGQEAVDTLPGSLRELSPSAVALVASWAYEFERSWLLVQLGSIAEDSLEDEHNLDIAGLILDLAYPTEGADLL